MKNLYRQSFLLLLPILLLSNFSTNYPKEKSKKTATVVNVPFFPTTLTKPHAFPVARPLPTKNAFIKQSSKGYKQFLTAFASDSTQAKSGSLPAQSTSITDEEKTGTDPIIFSMMASKKEVAVGEEFEIRITAEAFDTHAAGIFNDGTWNDYTLRVIMPKGFVQTGGDYYDLVQGHLEYPTNPKKEYTLKGKFTNYTENPCFELIRGGNGWNKFIKKLNICLSLKNIDEISLSSESNLYAKSIATLPTNITVGNGGFEVKPGQCPQRGQSITYRAKLHNGGVTNQDIYLYTCYRNCKGILEHKITVAPDTDNNGVWYEFSENIVYDKGQNILHTHIYSNPVTNYNDGLGDCSNNSHNDFDLTSLYKSLNFSVSPTIQNIVAGDDVTISALGCSDNNNISWSPSGKMGTPITVQPPTGITTYTATCTDGACTYTGTSTITATQNCGNPAPPTISTKNAEITDGESANIDADGCSGTVKWYGPSKNESIGQSVSVFKEGNYTATCTVACNGTNYTSTASNIVKITTVSLKINSNKDAAYANDAVTLTAIGCTNGSIEWKINGVFKEIENPTIVTGGGTYYARCVGKENLSDFVSKTITQLNPNDISLTATAYQVSPYENVTMTATGCSGGGQVYWYINNTTHVFDHVGTTYTVTGGGNTYYARCEVGNTQGNWANVTIQNITAESISLAAYTTTGVPTTSAYSNENVTLTASGCTALGAIIQWNINGDYNQWGRTKTITGAGTFTARCVIGSSNGDWATIIIQPKAADNITISADKASAYANELVVLTANGCTDPTGIIQWNINGSTSTYARYVGVTGGGIYQARCVIGNAVGGWATINIGIKRADNMVITSNKDYTDPADNIRKVAAATATEQIILTGTGCMTGNTVWDIKGSMIWQNGNITVTGYGIYKCRCVTSDTQAGGWGEWASITIPQAASGTVTVTPSKLQACTDEPVTLVADGCTNGTVWWTLPDNSTEFGAVLDAKGPGIYKAYCVRFGISGPVSSTTINPCPYGAPKFYASKTVVNPYEYVELKAVGCPGGDDQVQWCVPQNGGYNCFNFTRTRIVQGPGTYRGRCIQGSYTTYVDVKVFAAPADALQIIGDKTRANADEMVTLTATGCNFGTVQWKYGISTASGYRITPIGPGTYKARCAGDLSNNGNWVTYIVTPTNSIAPAITATPQRACPDTPVTLAATCPAGYIVQWQILKDEYSQYYFDNIGAVKSGASPYQVFDYNWNSSFTMNGPRQYWARCIKGDFSWIGDFDDKEFKVDSPFPDNFRATSNQATIQGSTLQLAATIVDGATYTWTPPSGVTLPTGTILSSRVLSIANALPAYSGTYTVTATYGTCSQTATVAVKINPCNIRIKAINPITGLETNYLPDPSGNSVQNDKLLLSAVNNDGTDLPTDFQYNWLYLGNNIGTTSTISVNKLGVYTLEVKPNSTAIGCKVNTNIYKIKSELLDWIGAINTTLQDNINTPVTITPVIPKRQVTFTLSKNGIPLDGNTFPQMYSSYRIYTQNGAIKEEKLYYVPTNTYLSNHTKISLTDFTGLVFISTNAGNFTTFKYNNGIAVMNDLVDCGTICWTQYIPLPYSEVPSGPGIVKYKDNMSSKNADGSDEFEAKNSGSTAAPQNTQHYETITQCTPIFCDPTATPPTKDNSSGASGTMPPPNPFKEDMCKAVATLLSFADRNDPQTNIVVKDVNGAILSKSFEKFKLLVRLTEDALARQFPQNASKILPATDAQIADALNKYSYGSNLVNSYQNAGCILTANYTLSPSIFNDDGTNKENIQEKVIPEVIETYLGLSPMLNDCGDSPNPTCDGKNLVDKTICALQVGNGLNYLDLIQNVDFAGDNFYLDDLPSFWTNLANCIPSPIVPTGNPDNPNEQKVNGINGFTVTYSPLTTNTPENISFKNQENVILIKGNSITDINNQLSNQCLKTVFNDLLNNNIKGNITFIFSSIFGVNSKFNVTFNESTNLPTNRLGQTTIDKINKDNNGNITSLDTEISLNVNELPNYSKEMIATVIAHEMVHGYLDSQNIFPPNLSESDINFAHHVHIATNYVSGIATQISTTYNISFKEASALMFSTMTSILNSVSATHTMNELGLTQADIYDALSKYGKNVQTGTRCN